MKSNKAGQCASFERFPPKGISNQLAVLFTKIPYSCSTKMSTQVLKELLCPPTREPPPKHIWDMVVWLVSARIAPLCQSGASCPPYTSALWHPGSSSFELFWRDVFFWNRLNGGRFGFGARHEVILCTPLKGPAQNLQFFAPNLIGKQKTNSALMSWPHQ